MAQKKNSRNSKKKNANLFTTACFVLALLVILLAFLVKKDQIIGNFKETGFFDRVFGTTPEFVQNHPGNPEAQKPAAANNNEITIQIDNQTLAEESEAPQENIVIPVQPQPKTEVAESNVKTPEKTPEKPKAAEETKTKPQPEKPKQSAKTELSLCFIQIDGDGSIVRKIVKRSVQKNDSPLTNALNLLLKGPDTTISAERNCNTLIPAGTKLLGAKVQNGVAYLNFNDAFEINSFGVEGYNAQLMQIVYTATAFSTVTSVQFLIDGQKKDYLGSEGQWIGSPLSRSNF